MFQRSKYCLVGVPDHQGVLNVGGRIGAALGPLAFRRALARMNSRTPIRAGLRDAGDVDGLGGDAAANHRIAADRIRDEHAATGISVVVGGGHDHGYSHLLGIAEACAAGSKSKSTTASEASLSHPRGTRGRPSRPVRLGCINIDAHLDVRKPEPIVTSGSPFYLAIESGVLDPSRFIEFGIQSHCNGPALWEYSARKKIEIVPFEKLRAGKAVSAFQQALNKLATRCDVIVVSLDLDAAADAFAPGVSAPQAEGFTPTEIIQMAELAGRASKVASLGIFELNPVHDLNDQTARLAATAAWHFLEQADLRTPSAIRGRRG